MVAKIHKSDNTIRLEYNLNSNQIINLVLLWSDERKEKGFQFTDLTVPYIKHIAKDMLQRHGAGILSKTLPDHLVLKRQDLLVAVKGYIEV